MSRYFSSLKAALVDNVKKNPAALRNVIMVVLTYLGIYGVIALLLREYDIPVSEVQQYFQQYGNWAIVVFVIAILIVALTPLPDTPVVAAGVLVLGNVGGFLTIWGGLVLAAAINFYVARWLGREYIERNFPQTIKYIDRFTNKGGFEVMVVGRTFTFVTFDLVSYVAGVTDISIGKYLIASTLGIFPVAVNYALIGMGLTAQSINGVFFSFVLSGLLAMLMGYGARYYRRRGLID